MLKVGLNAGVTGVADVTYEKELIPKRVGLFTVESNFSVCPYQRDVLGINWRQKALCQYPIHEGKAKPYWSVTTTMRRRMFPDFGVLVPIGSGKYNALYFVCISIFIALVLRNCICTFCHNCL